MFPRLFRKLYLRTKVQIEAENAKRIAQETTHKGVSCAEHAYLEDGDLLHKDTNNNFCSHLAAGGVVAASLSYRTLDRCTIHRR